MSEEHRSERDLNRIEAFSDGVFAIAITLLVLEVKVPRHDEVEQIGLGQALLNRYPSYFSYVLSFIMIGIYWANHHAFFHLFRRTNHVFNLLNVFFLMCISFMPFPTAVLGDFVMDAHERDHAITLYAFGLLLPAVGWFFIWMYASQKNRLIDLRLEPSYVRYLTRQYILSVSFYLLSFLISFWQPLASLAVAIGLTMLYLFPTKRPQYSD